MKDEFLTTCTYKAAAIMCATGKEPDTYDIINEGSNITILMRWNDRSSLPADKLVTGELLLDPIKFRDIHIPLKNKIIKMADQEKKKNERTNN